MANQESIELAVFLAHFANGIYFSAQDGKVNWTDAFHFVNAVTKAPAAFSNIKLVPSEIESWDAVEKSQVISYFKSNLKFDKPDLENNIEDIFMAGVTLAKAIVELIEKEEDGVPSNQPEV